MIGKAALVASLTTKVEVDATSTFSSKSSIEVRMRDHVKITVNDQKQVKHSYLIGHKHMNLR